jgi:hypothetical protein
MLTRAVGVYTVLLLKEKQHKSDLHRYKEHNQREAGFLLQCLFVPELSKSSVFVVQLIKVS